MTKLQEIVDQIRSLEQELLIELQKKQQDFAYRIQENRVYFDEHVLETHRQAAIGVVRYIMDASLANILTFPVIWLCLIPALLLDAVVSLYHSVCFRVYGIPLVKRHDYIIIDRANLAYLNVIERLNCIFCGYFNGLIAYVQEIAARTEQYWCPIKHARQLKSLHDRYHTFIDFGDYETYKDQHDEIRRDFNDLTDKD
jgi:hypothetical protein